MVHTKTIKIVLFTIDSRISSSPKCGGKGVFFNTLMEGTVRPLRQRLRCKIMLYTFSSLIAFRGCLSGGVKRHYLQKPPGALRVFSPGFLHNIF